MTAHKSELTTETNAYENIHEWLDCADGWQKLPSGKVLSVDVMSLHWWCLVDEIGISKMCNNPVTGDLFCAILEGRVDQEIPMP